MINLQYHKGQRCAYSSVFCQEGYCSECQVYLNWTSNTEILSQEGNKPLYSKIAIKEPELAINTPIYL